MTSTPTLARKHGSPVQHIINHATTPATTRCGKPLTGMARWSPADSRVDSKVWRTCEPCRQAQAQVDHWLQEIRDGKRCYDCGELFDTPEEIRLADENQTNERFAELEPKHVGCFQ